MPNLHLLSPRRHSIHPLSLKIQDTLYNPSKANKIPIHLTPIIWAYYFFYTRLVFICN